MPRRTPFPISCSSPMCLRRSPRPIRTISASTARCPGRTESARRASPSRTTGHAQFLLSRLRAECVQIESQRLSMSFPRKRESNFGSSLWLDARWSLSSGRALRGPGDGHDNWGFRLTSICSRGCVLPQERPRHRTSTEHRSWPVRSLMKEPGLSPRWWSARLP